MQGSHEEDAPRQSVADQMNGIYTNRVELAELVNFQKASIPSTLNIALDRIKSNAHRFAFYYLVFIVAVDFLFVLTNRLIVIPIAITVAFAFLYLQPITVREYTVQPIHAAIGCISMHVLIFILCKSLAKSYTYFFALNSLCLALVFLHGAILDTTEEDEKAENAV